MLGLVLGLCSALVWGTSALVGARSTRALGTRVSFAWGIVASLAVVAVPAVLTAPHHWPSSGTIAWVGIGAVGSFLGLFTMLHAYRTGAISVVAPIIACEGAVVAAFDVLDGGVLRGSTATLLAAATIGAAVVARGTRTDDPGAPASTPPVALASALAAATFYGVGLYGAAAASAEVGTFVPSLVTRLLGLAVVTVPVLAATRARVPSRIGLRWALLGGALDIGGMLLFVGSARAGSVAVAGVLSAQAAAVSALLGIVILGERLTVGQRLGFAVILGSVSALAAGL